MQSQCTRCGVVQPIEAFPSRGNGQRRKYCRDCRSAERRQRYADNPEPLKEKARLWASEHRDYTRGAARQRYQTHRDEALAQARQWVAENPEKSAEIKRRWAVENADRLALSFKAAAQVRTAIKRGSLARPTSCEECERDGVRITAAHADYSRPLDVRWLCHSCHSLWDHAQPKTL